MTGAPAATNASGETEIGGGDMRVWDRIEKYTLGGSTFAVAE